MLVLATACRKKQQDGKNAECYVTVETVQGHGDPTGFHELYGIKALDLKNTLETIYRECPVSRFEERVDLSKYPNPLQNGKIVITYFGFDTPCARIQFYSTTTGRELDSWSIAQFDDNSFLLQKNIEDEKIFYRSSKYYDLLQRLKKYEIDIFSEDVPSD